MALQENLIPDYDIPVTSEGKPSVEGGADTPKAAPLFYIDPAQVLNPEPLPRSELRSFNLPRIESKKIQETCLSENRLDFFENPEKYFPELEAGKKVELPSTLKKEKTSCDYPERFFNDYVAIEFIARVQDSESLSDFFAAQCAAKKWRFFRAYLYQGLSEFAPSFFEATSSIGNLTKRVEHRKKVMGRVFDQYDFISEEDKAAILCSFYDGVSTSDKSQSIPLNAFSLPPELRKDVFVAAIKRGVPIIDSSFRDFKSMSNDQKIRASVELDIVERFDDFIPADHPDHKNLVRYLTKAPLGNREARVNDERLTRRAINGTLNLCQYSPDVKNLSSWEHQLGKLRPSIRQAFNHDILVPFQRAGWIETEKDVDALFNFVSQIPVAEERDPEIQVTALNPAAYHFINCSSEKNWGLINEYIDGKFPMNYFLIEKFQDLDGEEKEEWDDESHYFLHQNHWGKKILLDIFEEDVISSGPSYKVLIPFLKDCTLFEYRTIFEMIYGAVDQDSDDPRNTLETVVQVLKNGYLSIATDLIREFGFFHWQTFLHVLEQRELPPGFEQLKQYSKNSGHALTPQIVNAFWNECALGNYDQAKQRPLVDRLADWQNFARNCQNEFGLDFSNYVTHRKDARGPIMISDSLDFDDCYEALKTLPFPVREKDSSEYIFYMQHPPDGSSAQVIRAVNIYIHWWQSQDEEISEHELDDEVSVRFSSKEVWKLHEMIAFVYLYEHTEMDDEAFIDAFEKRIVPLPMENEALLPSMVKLLEADYKKSDIEQFESNFPSFKQTPLMMNYLQKPAAERAAFGTKYLHLEKLYQAAKQESEIPDETFIQEALTIIESEDVSAALIDQFVELYPAAVRTLEFFKRFCQTPEAERNRQVEIYKDLHLVFTTCSKNENDPHQLVVDILDFLDQHHTSFVAGDITELKKIFPKTAIKPVLLFRYLAMNPGEKASFSEDLKNEKRRLLTTDESLVNYEERTVSALVLATLNRIDLVRFSQGIAQVDGLNIHPVPDTFRTPRNIEVKENDYAQLEAHEHNLCKNFIEKCARNSRVDIDPWPILDEAREAIVSAMDGMRRNGQADTPSFLAMQEYLTYEGDHDTMSSSTDAARFIALSFVQSRIKRPILLPYITQYMISLVFKKSEHLGAIFRDHVEQIKFADDANQEFTFDYGSLIPVIKEFFEEITSTCTVTSRQTAEYEYGPIRKNITGFGAPDLSISQTMIENEVDIEKRLDLLEAREAAEARKPNFDKEMAQMMTNQVLDFIRHKALSTVLEKPIEENPDKPGRRQVIIGAPKNEIDYFYAKDTCVSRYSEEMNNPQFIPLRILNEDCTELEGYIWCLEEDHPEHGKVLVISDIHPEVDIRGTFNPDKMYDEIVRVLSEYAKAGGYKMIVQTKNTGAQSNDTRLRGAIGNKIAEKTSIKLSSITKFPTRSSYDISECAILETF